MEGPANTKRFELTREPFARERISAVKEGFETMERKHPELVAFTLFGSLVKEGRTRPESDIDLYVYLDADQIMLNHPGEDIFEHKKIDASIRTNGRVVAHTYKWKDLRPDLDKKYREYVKKNIRTALPKQTGTKARPVSIDAFPVVISEAILLEYIDEIAKSYETYPDGIDDYMPFMSHIQTGSDAMETTPDSRLEPNQVLQCMFFLNVGNKLRPYRKLVIDKLIELGELGEKIWASLIRETAAYESNLDPDEAITKRYPLTLADAKGVYGS